MMDTEIPKGAEWGQCFAHFYRFRPNETRDQALVRLWPAILDNYERVAASVPSIAGKAHLIEPIVAWFDKDKFGEAAWSAGWYLDLRPTTKEETPPLN